MAVRADAYHQPWSHLLDHISSAQSTLRQRRGHCFRKLIVGSNMLLDAFEQGCVPAVVSSASSIFPSCALGMHLKVQFDAHTGMHVCLSVECSCCCP